VHDTLLVLYRPHFTHSLGLTQRIDGSFVSYFEQRRQSPAPLREPRRKQPPQEPPGGRRQSRQGGEGASARTGQKPPGLTWEARDFKPAQCVFKQADQVLSVLGEAATTKPEQEEASSHKFPTGIPSDFWGDAGAEGAGTTGRDAMREGRTLHTSV
jgi:hypothetical protein